MVMAMTTPRGWIRWSALVVVLAACGGNDAPGMGDTCFGLTITYTGPKTGAAYLRMVSTDGQGMFIGGQGPSIQVIMAAENGAVTCMGPGPRPDLPFSGVVWVDVSGTAATNCSSLRNPQCQPAPTDPQAHAQGAIRANQLTQIRYD